MNQPSIPIDKAKVYILSGKAVVIFTNTQTGETFKYKVTVSKDNEDYWYVNTLTKDPLSGRPHFLGCIRREYNIVNRDRTDVNFYMNTQYKAELQKCKDVFKWMWARIARGYWKRNSHEAEVYAIMHDGNCGRCGRPLTEPRSIELGLGKECATKLGIQY